MKEIINKIIKKRNISKYRLAKELGVSWNCLHLWCRGVFHPNKKNKIKLLDMYKKYYIIVSRNEC